MQREGKGGGIEFRALDTENQRRAIVANFERPPSYEFNYVREIQLPLKRSLNINRLARIILDARGGPIKRLNIVPP